MAIKSAVVSGTSPALDRTRELQDELERLIAHAKQQAAMIPQPLNIQINLSDERDISRYRYRDGRSGLLQSKLFLFVLVITVAMGGAYARTHYVCQTFKQSNKFYYGMSVDRCVGTLIETPLASMEQQLARLNASY